MVDVATFAQGPRVREWAGKHRLDPWLVARLSRLSDEPSRFLDGLLRRPPRYIRVHDRRMAADEVLKRLRARGFVVQPSALDPMACRVRNAPMSPGATMEHLQGLTTPQDLASASAVIALDPQRGERIADIAAAPGAKTIHIADRVQDAAAVVSVEPDPDRMRALRFNLERTQVSCVLSRQERAEQVPGSGWADRVLVDAPCTSEGTMPRDRLRRSGGAAAVQAACAMQQSIVDAADHVLRPGGVMVYATCTFAPEENEAQVQRLLERGYAMERLPFDRCGDAALGQGVTEWPGLRLDDSVRMARRFLPGIHPTLGFFVAKLRKGGP